MIPKKIEQLKPTKIVINHFSFLFLEGDGR